MLATISITLTGIPTEKIESTIKYLRGIKYDKLSVKVEHSNVEEAEPDPSDLPF